MSHRLDFSDGFANVEIGSIVYPSSPHARNDMEWAKDHEGHPSNYGVITGFLGDSNPDELSVRWSRARHSETYMARELQLWCD